MEQEDKEDGDNEMENQSDTGDEIHKCVGFFYDNKGR
jgi:hypothetical protein